MGIGCANPEEEGASEARTIIADGVTLELSQLGPAFISPRIPPRTDDWGLLSFNLSYCFPFYFIRRRIVEDFGRFSSDLIYPDAALASLLDISIPREANPTPTTFPWTYSSSRYLH